MNPLVFFPDRLRRCVTRQRQLGFTLVEVALGLAVLGILAVVALQSRSALEGFHQQRFVQSVQSLTARLSAYRESQGRWPGDCNRDGLIDPALLTRVTLTADRYDYAVPEGFSAAASSADTYTLGQTCPESTLTPYDALNVPFNELKVAGIVSAGEPNRTTAHHPMGGFMFLGTLTTVADSPERSDTAFNVLVLTDVPVSAARQLAIAIDGADGSAAHLNRVRRSSDLETFDALWTASGETQDTRITVVVLFDRVPPPPAT